MNRYEYLLASINSYEYLLTYINSYEYLLKCINSHECPKTSTGALVELVLTGSIYMYLQYLQIPMYIYSIYVYNIYKYLCIIVYRWNPDDVCKRLSKRPSEQLSSAVTAASHAYGTDMHPQ